jgi:uncharacterized protein
MLKRNGYVLEQLYSPLVLRTSPPHEELKELGRRCVTRNHFHHYEGFAENQWRLFQKEEPPRVKPLLYVFRVLLTGIHLMRTGVIEANLVHLNQEFRLDFLEELIQLKLGGPEKGRIERVQIGFYEKRFQALMEQLKREAERSHLPEEPTAGEALHDLLIQIRLRRGSSW